MAERLPALSLCAVLALPAQAALFLVRDEREVVWAGQPCGNLVTPNALRRGRDDTRIVNDHAELLFDLTDSQAVLSSVLAEKFERGFFHPYQQRQTATI